MLVLSGARNFLVKQKIRLYCIATFFNGLFERRHGILKFSQIFSISPLRSQGGGLCFDANAKFKQCNHFTLKMRFI